MKKKIITTTLLLFFSFISYQSYLFFIVSTDSLQSIYLIPKDAIYVLETRKPIDNWDKISTSEIWKHLQKNEYFNELTESLNELDGVFNQKKKVFNFIGNRSLLISAHMIKKKEYALFYVLDLQKFSKLTLLKNHLNTFVNKNFRFSKRSYHNEIINEIYDKTSRKTLYITFIKNQLIASYTHVLVEASIDQYQEPIIGRDLSFIEIHKKVGYDDLFRLYFQYDYLDDYMYYFSDKPNDILNLISKSLVYSGFSFDLKSDNFIYANGFTNTNQNTTSYLKALQKSGKGKIEIAKIAPKRTAVYVSFAFNSFIEFYKNFEVIQKENPKQYKTYQDNLDKIENVLKINIKDNFMSWIGNEIALLHMQSSDKTSNENEVALVIKTNSIKDAQTNLDFILKQIKKRTPVKFKQINYKDHKISFLAIKGFFKFFLGKLFQEFDKPYFTFIDDCIVFSNHPSTLKNIINDYVKKNTLHNAKDYQSFISNFDKKSSFFTYINTPTLYKGLKNYVDKNTINKLEKNKNYIICFPQIGFQLTPYVNLFESKLVVNYQDPKIVKTKEQFKEMTLIGPTKNQITTATNNLLSIDKERIFNISEVYLNNLNDNTYLKKYTSGKTHIKLIFKNGMKHGKYREYYPNGKTKISGKFRKDIQIGTWRYYSINGNLIFKKKF
ncbi:MAG: DUF3352 domain-containing protein [Flavobacteriaceae bacterium]|nr:DUF3352 domain-containing protein [Flavobacteriaceae bacterium]